MVNCIRNIEKAISGNGIKEPSLSEKKNIHIARKSIHLSRDLKSGSVITEKDIIPLRPGDGICAMNWENVIGQKVNTDLKKFTKLTWKNIFMKIGVLTSSRADYGIYLPLLNQLKADIFFDLEIIAFGTHLSNEHGFTVQDIEKDGYMIIFTKFLH